MERTALSMILFLGLVLSVRPCGAAWDPDAFRDAGTLELLTVEPEQGEHWSKVWLVVLDGQVYVRLGSRMSQRIERNTTAPYVGIEIAGQKFDRVRAESVPSMAERVAEAMAEKYTTDIFVRFFSHPLTMRLVVEDE